ncbi:hypothetical protein HELRODRAFT_192408 [Helobdella robusta]|uniref:Uncharacterized protein n=1 Tax=Helobdella robusta TaxID=6412 RepID=T1FTX3_HELRO|nr:hypothetical protein HELRODRAFT_192408 [Helobdella robusta]ESO00765.1 hypothetical protein HELRODRAFT_192408 [Helobdella robusta]
MPQGHYLLSPIWHRCLDYYELHRGIYASGVPYLIDLFAKYVGLSPKKLESGSDLMQGEKVGDAAGGDSAGFGPWSEWVTTKIEDRLKRSRKRECLDPSLGCDGINEEGTYTNLNYGRFIS